MSPVQVMRSKRAVVQAASADLSPAPHELQTLRAVMGLWSKQWSRSGPGVVHARWQWGGGWSRWSNYFSTHYTGERRRRDSTCAWTTRTTP